MSINLRQLRFLISEFSAAWLLRFDRDVGFFEASLGCSKFVSRLFCFSSMKRKRALRGRNLLRDNRTEGASKALPKASGNS